MLQPILPLTFGLVAVTAFAALGARRSHIPYSIFLVLLGLAIGFLPGMPRIELRPDLVLSLLLPPLLYRAGVNMSWRGFKANLRPILLLAVGLVIFTTVAVAGVSHYLLGLPLAAGFVLGAIVSPPDAVAPMSIARRFALPQRVLTILEGEGLVNDATALILFSFAIEAVTQGRAFSLSTATGEFLLIVAGEIVWGLAIGWGILALRRWASEPRVEMVFALLTPFAAFWVPESLGGSGVLATVIAGLYVSWNGPRYISPATRLQGFFVWDLVVYLIEGLVFLMTGLQARIVADTLNLAEWGHLALACAAVCAAIIVVRFVWVFFATYLPRAALPGLARRDPAPPWQNTFVIAFTGIRGVVSLAAALSIPMMAGDAAFPDRGPLLLITFSVILVTLVGQGFTLPWVIGLLGIAEHGRREADDEKRREITARLASIDAALARLDTLEGAVAAPETVTAIRRRNQDRRAYFVAACQDLVRGDVSNASAALQIQFLDAERANIADLYYRGEISDEARRRIERELDLEDSRIRHAAESGAARAL
ncbi:MAG TPA: Na+/H+ antiporter [Rhizomicrobium sp.]|nr:Na+/H+ antiporter [Rhizomicrobium sp.]